MNLTETFKTSKSIIGSVTLPNGYQGGHTELNSIKECEEWLLKPYSRINFYTKEFLLKKTKNTRITKLELGM